LDYAWYTHSSGNLYIYENGVYVSSFGAYNTTDVLSVAYAGSTVSYLRNGIVQRSVATTAGRSLYFDSALHSAGFTLTDIQIGTATLTSTSPNLTINGNTLTKTGATGWDTDAYSNTAIMEGAANGTGNSLNNVLTGNTGANTLTGGAGDDTLTGGSGADSFRFVSTSHGTDSITDFQSGTDKIQVISPNFGNIPVGTLTSDRFVAAGTALTNGNAVFIYNGSTGGLTFDSDGNGTAAAVQIATLTGSKTLLFSDIQVVAA
jgi:Ca2+-binding RTX toxin-like protein